MFAAAEIDVLFHAAPFEQFFESLRTDTVNLAQRRKNSFAGVDFVTHMLRHGLGHSLAGEQIEGIVSQQGDRLIVRFDRQQLVAQGDAGRQLVAHFRRSFGDVRTTPAQMEFVGQVAVKSVLVDFRTVEQCAHERGLTARGVLQ